MLYVASAVTFFGSEDFKALEVFAEGIADQGRPVALCAAGGAVGGLQQFGVEYDLDRFHGVRILHS
jgi:hypothetical protein